MTPSPDDEQAPQGATGRKATEADVAGMSPAVAGGVGEALGQPSQSDDDAGLASAGEALDAGQAPQVGPGKERVESASEPAGAAGRAAAGGGGGDGGNGG